MERLPPLNAIKTFEVAARAGSFTLAASELGVSSAAVSQQIRNLETWFGKQLFVQRQPHRAHRRRSPRQGSAWASRLASGSWRAPIWRPVG
ncbi:MULTISPECIES: LysR family transcriptional regulator [Mesorhizobium]|uniref:LysR family transcriptional regulator n=1 Tax=Mesorhizobium TaxID=68287 RepID=UPI000418E382